MEEKTFAKEPQTLKGTLCLQVFDITLQWNEFIAELVASHAPSTLMRFRLKPVRFRGLLSTLERSKTQMKTETVENGFKRGDFLITVTQIVLYDIGSSPSPSVKSCATLGPRRFHRFLAFQAGRGGGGGR